MGILLQKMRGTRQTRDPRLPFEHFETQTRTDSFASPAHSHCIVRKEAIPHRRHQLKFDLLLKLLLLNCNQMRASELFFFEGAVASQKTTALPRVKTISPRNFEHAPSLIAVNSTSPKVRTEFRSEELHLFLHSKHIQMTPATRILLCRKAFPGGLLKAYQHRSQSNACRKGHREACQQMEHRLE